MSDEELRKKLTELFYDMGLGETIDSDSFADQLLHLIKDQRAEARIDARDKLLNKLVRLYSPINKPIKESPMELTAEAEYYNKFSEDLFKFAQIEWQKMRRPEPPLGQER